MVPLESVSVEAEDHNFDNEKLTHCIKSLWAADVKECYIWK